MKRKVQVVMLPTEKATSLQKRNSNPPHHPNYPQGYLHYENNPLQDGIYWESQHLYFTVDEEIKENDWFIENENTLIRCTKEVAEFINGNGNAFTAKKIVATTDFDLTIKNSYINDKDESVFSVFCLPKIPTDFIQAYTREQGAIKEIMLEYLEEEFNDPTGKYAELKLRSNGTVICHPIQEKKYTREEVRIKFEQFLMEDAYSLPLNRVERQAYFNKWFNHNYPE